MKDRGVTASTSSSNISKVYVGQRINDQEGIFGQVLAYPIKHILPRTNNPFEGRRCGLTQNLPVHPKLPPLAARWQRKQHNYASTGNTINMRKRPTSRKEYRLFRKKPKKLVGIPDESVIIGIQFLGAVTKVTAINVMALNRIKSIFALHMV